jgi:MoxR-like ATPase
MRVPVDYPTDAEEHDIVERAAQPAPPTATLLDAEDVVELQRIAAAVHVDAAVSDYAVRLVIASRRPADAGIPQVEGLLAYGASPRASLGLVAAARALALLRGRAYAVPQDVYEIAYDVLNHRLVLSFDALADGVTVDDVLVELLTEVPAPRLVSAPLAPEAPDAGAVA